MKFIDKILAGKYWVEVTDGKQATELLKFKASIAGTDVSGYSYDQNWYDEQLLRMQQRHPGKDVTLCVGISTPLEGGGAGWNPKFHMTENTHNYYTDNKIITYKQALSSAKRR